MHEKMDQDELQRFYDTHKDEVFQLYFYGEGGSIELHNLIKLVRTVVIDGENE